MAGGGKRPGAGRPKGSRNKRTREQLEAVQQGGQTPLQFLTSVYRNPEREMNERIDAAKAAAPFVHPKLASSQVDMTVVDETQRLTDAELDARIAQLLKQHGKQG